MPGQLLTRRELACFDLPPKLHGDARRKSLARDSHER